MGKKISVKNRSAGSVIYSVPDLRVRRDFTAGEVKTVDSDELLQLSYTQGGAALINEYLQILDEPVRQEVSGDVEPEYNYTNEDIKRLILTDSLDKFLDALDFAPIGVIDLIKQYAVSLPMVDMNKMEAMKQQLGFDVLLAIKSTTDDKDAQAEAPKRTRRVSTGTDASKKPRRAKNITKK